jgi:UDP-glucose 4-epimerase
MAGIAVEMESMKALIIGGNGFIGSHLVDSLVETGWEVVILDVYKRRYDPIPEKAYFIQGDISQKFLLREALNGVDVVFHLAWTSIHEISNLDTVVDVQDNLIPSLLILNACRVAQVKKIVFLSSGGTVYGAPQKLPIKETSQKYPLNSYGILKLTVEKYLQLYKHLYGLDYTVLRPSVPYGPRQNPLGRQGAVSVFLYRVTRGLPIQIWGDGQTSRDYFYIADLIQALTRCTRKTRHAVYNIGGGREITLLELLHEVERAVNREAITQFLPARDFDVQNLVLDTTLALKDLQWKPGVPLQQGIEMTCHWLTSYFPVEQH